MDKIAFGGALELALYAQVAYLDMCINEDSQAQYIRTTVSEQRTVRWSKFCNNKVSERLKSQDVFIWVKASLSSARVIKLVNALRHHSAKHSVAGEFLRRGFHVSFSCV